MTRRNNLCNIMQHNLVFNYLETKSTTITTYFWAVTYLLAFTTKPHPTHLQNEITINTLVFIRGHTVLVFSTLLCSFIAIHFSFKFII